MQKKTYTLEIACDSLTAAIKAERAGANRIELCSNLAQGGTTPSAATIKLAKAHLNIPVFVLIRPRKGDFLYTELELSTIIEDIEIAKQLGADGIVAGCLTANGTLNKRQLEQMLIAAAPLPFTFHRAFDMCRDPEHVLEQLIDLGVNCVLTSGQASTAVEGQANIAQWVKQAAQRVKIVAGAGVRSNNIKQLLNIPELLEFHSSAKTKQISKMQFRGHTAMGSEAVEQEFEWRSVSEEEVRKLRLVLDHYDVE